MFAGWAESVRATEVEYTDGQTVTNLAGTETTAGLYAIWVDSEYTICYSVWDDEDQFDSQDANYGEATVLKAFADTGITAPEGKTFAYWAICDDAGNATATFADKATVTNLAGIESSVYLYAVFAESTYVVHLMNGNDGVEQTFTYGTAANLKTFAETGFTAPEGQVFAYWSTSQIGSDYAVRYTDGAEVSNLTIYGDIYLYAVFEDDA